MVVKLRGNCQWNYIGLEVLGGCFAGRARLFTGRSNARAISNGVIPR